MTKFCGILDLNDIENFEHFILGILTVKITRF